MDDMLDKEKLMRECISKLLALLKEARSNGIVFKITGGTKKMYTIDATLIESNEKVNITKPM